MKFKIPGLCEQWVKGAMRASVFVMQLKQRKNKKDEEGVEGRIS